MEENYEELSDEIAEIKESCRNASLKVILETCLLTKDEIVKLCKLAEVAGADFVKTSTGFSIKGATPEDVALMRKSVSERVKVKASGGIRSYKDALLMIECGADRLGVSSGVKIVEEEKKES